MAHVVMQAAEFATEQEAEACEAELQELRRSYVAFEAEDDDPWGTSRVAPPLAAFGDKHDVAWPNVKDARFLLKGLFEDAASILRIDRMVFFWGGGFTLGGETLRTVFERMGAVLSRQWCHLKIHHTRPLERLRELCTFLESNDYEDQFLQVEDEESALEGLFSITIDGGKDAETVFLCFGDSGVEDWAFVSMLPQLIGSDPSLIEDEL